MADNVSLLSDDIKVILQYIKTKKDTVPLVSETKYYVHNIRYFKDKFNKYHEETTPKSVLSSLYHCVGRLKFFGDKMLYIYLETGERTPRANNLGSAALWPVKVSWNLEIFDEDSERSFSLGHASCVFNRPRQGLMAHPNDWISIDLAKIQNSGCIAQDGSATLKWTVETAPVFQIENVEEFQQRLEDLQKLFENYDGPDKQLSNILKIGHENNKKLTSMEGKLDQLETSLEDLKKQLCEFKSETEPAIRYIKKRYEMNENMPSNKKIKTEKN